MDDKISFSWDLHFVCNYRCPYCWFDGKWGDLSKFNLYPSLADVLKAWGRIHDRYGAAHIHLLGGEPLVYPRFPELIRALSRSHNVSCTTNLSVDVDEFLHDIDSARVRFSPTFHPRFADFDRFVSRLLKLQGQGLAAAKVGYLAYPPQIPDFESFRKRFAAHGIALVAMTFWGDYGGISFPAGYSQEEKSIIEPYLADRDGEKFQLEPKKVKGMLCGAGQRYAVVKPDGAVVRCGGSSVSQSMGNLFDDHFALADQPQPCVSDHCPCNEWVALLLEEVA